MFIIHTIIRRNEIANYLKLQIIRYFLCKKRIETLTLELIRDSPLQLSCY